MSAYSQRALITMLNNVKETERKRKRRVRRITTTTTTTGNYFFYIVVTVAFISIVCLNVLCVVYLQRCKGLFGSSFLLPFFVLVFLFFYFYK